MEKLEDFLNIFTIEASRMNVTLFCIFLALLYWYSVHPFSALSKCGIKHPKPVPFFGNMFMFRKGFYKPLSDIVKTHGKLSGYYLGRKPNVLIADPDMLRQILVKDFTFFPNRQYGYFTKPLKDCLLMLTNERWKRVRSIVTPTFSTAKLKEMVPLINTATDALMNNMSVHAESGKAFDIHKCFRYFTLDVIASVAFGTQVDSQKNPDHPLVRHIQMFFALDFFRPLQLLYSLFPGVMAPFARFIPTKQEVTIDAFFNSSIQSIIKQRDEQPPDQRRRDFLQLMLDARTGQEAVSLEQFDTGSHSDELKARNQQKQPSAPNQTNGHSKVEESVMKQPQKKMMTEDELVGQAVLFILAGYDTTSNTLAFACYLLALHPECQRKVQEEVDGFFTTHDSPDYTNIQDLKYLEMVLSETLRHYPPGFRFIRQVDHDCEVNGQFFSKGMTLVVPVGSLHHDPDYWPEPEKFIPERFTPEAKANRHPFVYLPFGAGPRNCVGMRLAQLEIRMALARLLHRFSITACSETKVPLDLKSFGTLGPKNGVFVKITKRNK